MTATIASRPSTAGVVIVGIVASISIVALGLFGLSSFALAVAFPLAIQVVDQLQLVVSPRDLAIAQQIAPFAWVFGVLAWAAFSAALVTLVKLGQFVEETQRP